ncbi:MAG: hypothetical protein ACK56I_35440, partial [bacterium]
VVTAPACGFSLGDDRMSDVIHMAEIESCSPYDPDSHLGDNHVPEEAGLHALQIETSPDGYNSGLLTAGPGLRRPDSPTPRVRSARPAAPSLGRALDGHHSGPRRPLRLEPAMA